jgi:hypothetical protein
MRVFSFYYGAIGATMRGFCARLFGAFSMKVATTAPQTSGELLAVGQVLAKVLSSVEIYLDNNMIKAIQLKYLL